MKIKPNCMVPLHCHPSLFFLPQGNHRTKQGLQVTKRTCTNGLEVTKLKNKLEGGVIILQVQITYNMRCLPQLLIVPKNKTCLVLWVDLNMKPNILYTVPEQGLLTYLHPGPKGI
jgi:hypothetical protein